MKKTTDNNHYIRGTNSTTLSLIEKNGGILSKSVEMAENGLAPLASELDTKGACLGATEGKPSIAFGRLWTPNNYPHMTYDLDKVIKDYASLPVRNKKTISEAIDSYCKKPAHMIVPMINALLIYVTNANQLGIKYDKESLMNSLHEGIQYFYFLLIFCLNFDSNLKEIFKASYFTGKMAFGNIIKDNLNTTSILKRLRNMDIDLKKTYLDLDEEKKAINDVLQCFIIENDEKIHRYVKKYGNKLHPFFKKKDNNSNDKEISKPRKEYATFLANNIKKGMCDFSELSEYVLYQKECPQILSEIAGKIEPEIREAERLIEVIKNSFEKKCPKVFWIDPFPLIFLVNANSQFIKPENETHSEYCSTRSLKLGVDITLLATNTKKNARKLIQWLGRNKFYCIKVCLFSELGEYVIKRKEIPYKFDSKVLHQRSSAFKALSIIEKTLKFISQEELFQDNSNNSSCVSTSYD